MTFVIDRNTSNTKSYKKWGIMSNKHNIIDLINNIKKTTDKSTFKIQRENPSMWGKNHQWQWTTLIHYNGENITKHKPQNDTLAQ